MCENDAFGNISFYCVDLISIFAKMCTRVWNPWVVEQTKLYKHGHHGGFIQMYEPPCFIACPYLRHWGWVLDLQTCKVGINDFGY
jgi:hypothetical protein